MNNNPSDLSPTILLVDDEPHIIEIIIEDLKSMGGIRLLSANNVADAMHLIENDNVSVILSDITMPGKTGMDFCRSVRAKGLDTPFVFLTAYESSDHLRMAIGLGATDFLEKPYEKQDLLDVLWKSLYIGQKQQQINAAVKTLADSHESGETLKNLIETERQRIGLVKAAKTKVRKSS